MTKDELEMLDIDELSILVCKAAQQFCNDNDYDIAMLVDQLVLDLQRLV